MLSFLTGLFRRKATALPAPAYDARSSIDNHRRELNTPANAIRHFWRAS